MDERVVLTSQGLIAAAALAIWIRTGLGGPAKTPAARLRETGWCAALLAVAAVVADMNQSVPRPLYFAPYTWLSIYAALLSVGAVLVLRPRLAFGLLPAALIALGGYGSVLVRDYTFWEPSSGHYVFLTLGRYHMQYYLVLAVAYGLLLLGGALAWRVIGSASPGARLVLGPRLADPARPGAGWALVLLPVTAVAAMLLIPNIWLGSGSASRAWTIIVLLAVTLIIRQSPDAAASLAAAGLLALGAAGFTVAGTSNGTWTLPTPASGAPIYGLIPVTSPRMGQLAIAQAIVLAGLGLLLALRIAPQGRRLLGLASTADLVRRVQRLTESRAVAVDTAAADLRRLERDLHDGAQARLVALGMHLRAVEKLIPTSPDAALALVAEARETSARALTDLRELVRGVHPPVLADRGLGDAVRALALDTPMRIETEVFLPARLPAPIETACYFAVAEVLTNAVKHSGARAARICVTHADGMLRIVVTDFGIGGADASRGTGLAGVEKRLATFDGIMAVSSPVGGPTMVVMEVPCASSSLKISSC